MTEKTNPAARLHAVLSKTLTVGASNSQMLQVWAKAMEVPEDPMVVCAGLNALSREVEHLEDLVRSLPHVDHKLYLSTLDSVMRALNPMYLGAQRQGVVENILKPEILLPLKFCSDQISRVFEEETIAEEDLKVITESIQDLFTAIRNSTTLDSTLRTALLRLLEAARQAVIQYQISGAVGLKDSLQSILGFIMSEKEMLRQAKAKDEGVLERLGRLLDKLDKFTSAATKGYRILKSPISALIGFAVDHISDDDSSPPGESDIPDIVA